MTVREQLTSVDGEIFPADEARISPADDGLLRGDGVFEVVKSYAGRPHALDEHLDRLERSAAAIHLDVPRQQLEDDARALLERAGDEDALLRLVVTRGGRRLAFIEPCPEWPESAKVATVRYEPTIVLTGVKSLSYGANMHSTRIAKAGGADEAVLVRADGTVLEGPTCSIFWVGGDGHLRTPSLDVGILDSIVRGRIVEALEVEEGSYPLADLLGASEAFLASTSREIQPVSEVDGEELSVCPGPRTEEAIQAFREVLDREL